MNLHKFGVYLLYFLEVFANKYASTYDKEKGILLLFSEGSGCGSYLAFFRSISHVCLFSWNKKGRSPYIYMYKGRIIRKSSLFVPPLVQFRWMANKFHPSTRLRRFGEAICTPLPPGGKFATEDGK